MPALARSAFSPSALIGSTVTGSARIEAHSSSTPVFFESHFVLHPKARDSARGPAAGQERLNRVLRVVDFHVARLPVVVDAPW